MLARITFALAADARQRFTHFIEPDGTTYALQPLNKLEQARVCIIPDYGVTGSQLVSMAHLARAATELNSQVSLEYGPGLSPYASNGFDCGLVAFFKGKDDQLSMKL